MSKKALFFISGVSLALTLCLSQCQAKTIKPTKDKDFFKVTVRILNMDESSGGSGAILSSSKNGSTILTNSHVCEVVKDGGVVDPPNHNRASIIGIKRYTQHDLCLIKVGVNLGVSLKIAKEAPEAGDEAIISGHPNLLPVIVTRGHFSENKIVSINYGNRVCSDKEKEDPNLGFICALMGGIPDIKTLEAKVLSATISPGSSGSPIFNNKGEIAAVAFAGMGPLSYGFAVPLEHIHMFMEEAAISDWDLIQAQQATQ